MSFDADFQSKFIARKIRAKYGELTEIQGEEYASTQRATGPSKMADFGIKNRPRPKFCKRL